MTHHVAQLNVARLKAPIDARETAGFVEMLDPINALADAAEGFVWRLQTDEGNATSVLVDDTDPMFLVNLSVWETVDALRSFVFDTAHVEVMRQRAKWFHRSSEAYTVLWWVPAGHEPSTDEAMARLAQLRAEGPGDEVFTFTRPARPPDTTPPASP